MTQTLSYLMTLFLQVSLQSISCLHTDGRLPVDAHVGNSLFQDAIGGLRNRGITVILVTHAIHFLSRADYIYTLNNGTITESGTYDELISRGGDFARLDLEFGGHASKGKDDDKAEEVIAPQKGVTIEDAKLKSEKAREKATGSGKLEGRLIVKEKRSTGSVSWEGAVK
jgi:ATP-binding cassette, subfamily C (CFTR/MRP), member 1